MPSETGNSTKILLGAGETFTGNWESVLQYTTAAVALLGSVPTDGTLFLDVSTDGGSTFASVPNTISDVKFTVSYDKFHGKAYLHTNKIPIPDYDSSMELFIDDGVKSTLGGPKTSDELKRQTSVPGMLTHFRIENANLTLVRNDQYEAEQVLILTSTALVSLEDLTKSLEVYLLPKDRPKRPGEKKGVKISF